MANKGKKHEHYEVLNFIGYGLSKFNMDFVYKYGYSTKTAFYEYIVSLGIAETVGTVKNRQDLFDGMIEGGQRKGWWQKGSIYKHRRDFIDSKFGDLDVSEYVEVVKMAIEKDLGVASVKDKIMSASPILRSRFKQIQETGREAEYYFYNNYQQINRFENARIKDARLFGDGYDFQIETNGGYFLAEVKGLKTKQGNVRFTKNEYEKAQEYKEFYALIVVSNIADIPMMVSIFNPVQSIPFEKRIIKSEQIEFHSQNRFWE